MKLKVLKFGSSWCGPCRQLAPIIEKLKEENKDIEFEDVDVDEDRAKAVKYGVRGIPALFFMRDDEVQSTLVGRVSKEEIQEHINLLGE